jgi:hypothetical protein
VILARFLCLAALPMLAGCGSQSATPPTSAPVSAPWPPHSMADLQALAATDSGTAAVFKSETSGGCTCRVYMTLPSGLSGSQIASAMLKVFFDDQMDTLGEQPSTGSAGVFAMHSASEYGQTFTVGRVDLSTNGSQHTITIDIGASDNPQEYTVTS